VPKAIARFVDRAFPGPKLIPEDAMLCGKVEQWVSVANTAIFPVLLGYLLCYFFPKTPDGQPDRVAIEKALPEVRSKFDLLGKAVAKTGHLAGASLSMPT
jgi:glutathione S-transferase